MGLLDWDNDGKIEPHEIGGATFIAGMLNSLANGDAGGSDAVGGTDAGGSGAVGGANVDNSNDVGGSNAGGVGGSDDTGGLSCGCLVALALVPFLAILGLFFLH